MLTKCNPALTSGKRSIGFWISTVLTVEQNQYQVRVEHSVKCHLTNLRLHQWSVRRSAESLLENFQANMPIIVTAICEYNGSGVFHLYSTCNLSLINATAMLDDTRKTYDYLAAPIVQLQSSEPFAQSTVPAFDLPINRRTKQNHVDDQRCSCTIHDVLSWNWPIFFLLRWNEPGAPCFWGRACATRSTAKHCSGLC